MPSYKNMEQVWFTVQALRMYQDLSDCEILVVDNFGDPNLENWIRNLGAVNVRYEKATGQYGTAPAKQAVFARANGQFVLCIDSHVLLRAGAIAGLKQWIKDNPDCSDLIQGPLQFDQLNLYVDRLDMIWKTHFPGVWGPNLTQLVSEPYEIPMHGMGLFGCFRDKWLNFNPKFKGFGGEEFYIHEKYRKAGHKVICLPWMIWTHKFHVQSEPTLYLNSLEDRLGNYIIGFNELGIDKAQLVEHFGQPLYDRAMADVRSR
jgi:glycosyltransferase involved in cell wall biosynthesis